MIAIKNNLVATDFSAPADAALLYGRALARTFAATLHVVHVIGDLSALAYGADGYVATLPDMQRNVESAARQQLAELLTERGAPMPNTRPVLVTSNATAAAIVDYADRTGIDLIVTSTHGRGAVAHLLMGSVAERVVRTAGCPVLTVRHPEREFVSADAELAGARARTSESASA
jgi:nucleotide-binding universal stress UspA family protein